MPKPRVKGKSSERIARGILAKLGYEVIETNKIVTVDDARIFEVDIIARNSEDEVYCVEVKSGQAGVSDVRQVFGNSEILGLKPMLICKGFANEAAETMARELKVKMIRLTEHFILLEPEELEVIVSTAVQDILNKYGFYPIPHWNKIKEEDWNLISTISEAERFKEAAENASLSVKQLGQRIGDLRQVGIFPRKGQSFTDLKRHSRQLMYRYSIKRKLERIENRLKKIEEALYQRQRE
ncbi:MAG: YraN family protein [Thermoproteota archaeon]